MKLVINNETHWRTCDLRRFFVRCAKQEGMTIANITVVYNRQIRGCVTGYAYYDSTHCRIKVPSQEIDPVDLAMVVAHEFAHNKNVRHTDMRGDPHYDRTPRTAEVYAWAKNLPLRKVAPKPKQRPTLEDRCSHATMMVRAWESKLKRTQTYLRKWRRRVKRYEARAANARNAARNDVIPVATDPG